MDRPHEAEKQGKWTKTLVKSGNYPNLRYTAGGKTKRNVSYILEQNIGLKIPKKQRNNCFWRLKINIWTNKNILYIYTFFKTTYIGLSLFSLKIKLLDFSKFYVQSIWIAQCNSGLSHIAGEQKYFHFSFSLNFNYHIRKYYDYDILNMCSTYATQMTVACTTQYTGNMTKW